MPYAQFVTQRRLRRIGSEAGAAFLYTPGANTSLMGMTFTRASTALYRDADGVWQSAATNVLRNGHYIGSVLTTLREGAATNLLTYGRDLTNVAWTATDVTVAATTGADGVALSGSRLTATGANGTVIRAAALVHGSAAYAGSFVAKRITGTGNIDITLDNGSTWTTVTLTAAYTQLFKTQTLANSQFGIRLVTSGDVIDVDFCQNETGAVPSSPIGTTTAAVTRAADLWSFGWSRNPEAGTWYVDLIDLNVGATVATAFLLGTASGTNTAFSVYRYTGGKWNGQTTVAAGTSISAVATADSFGDRAELRNVFAVSGGNITATLGQSINGAAEEVAAAGTARAIDAAFSVLPARLYIGTIQTGASPANLAIRSIVYVPGPATSLAAMRVLAGG
ncbi:MAG: hypothetical protein WC700_14365 [Gemmatimonadaceae bacterium]|jgi:hypothetical protein